MSASRTGRVYEFALDLRPLRAPEIAANELAYVVLRAAGRVVGRLVIDGARRLPPEGFLAAARAAAREGLETVREESAAGGRAGGPTPGDVSVIIATRNRVDGLRVVLASLHALHSRPGQVIVADSASDDAAGVATVAREARADLVRCDRPGLSLARNAGAAAAGGEILAFLDDDCRVDASWLDGLLRGFTDPGVSIVTGSFAPAELATPAQRLFLAYSHMDRRGFAPRRFTRDREESKYWPLDAWRMGSGGNLAVRAEAFRARGGFRTDLGLGTPALGGEDLYFLWSTVREGGDVVYRPDAMAWHGHHRDLPALRRVMFGYGVGHRAFLDAAIRAGAPPGRVSLCAASFWYDRTKRLARAVLGAAPGQAGLVLREMAGMSSGTRRGRRARRQAR